MNKKLSLAELKAKAKIVTNTNAISGGTREGGPLAAPTSGKTPRP